MKSKDDDDYDGPMKFNWDKAKPNPYVKKPDASPRDILSAKEILTDYQHPDETSFIDIGNVYFAATTFEAAYDHLKRRLDVEVASYESMKEERDALAKRVAELEKWKADIGLLEQINYLQSELAAARQEIERLKNAITTMRQLSSMMSNPSSIDWDLMFGNDNSQLTQANQRIKELVEESNKQMHRGDDLQVSLSLAYDDMTAMTEREQRLVACLSEVNRLFAELQWDGLGKAKADKVHHIRALLLSELEANKGGA